MQIVYEHQETKPILPALGDVRLIAELSYDSSSILKEDRIPKTKISVVKCVEILEHHVVYEFLEEKKRLAIPFEKAEKWGFTNIDSAIRWIIDTYLNDVLKTKKNESIEMFSVSNGIEEYFEKLQHLVILSKQTLKEAEKAKRIFQRNIQN